MRVGLMMSGGVLLRRVGTDAVATEGYAVPNVQALQDEVNEAPSGLYGRIGQTHSGHGHSEVAVLLLDEVLRAAGLASAIARPSRAYEQPCADIPCTARVSAPTRAYWPLVPP